MKPPVVAAILWVLVAVTLIGYLGGLVTLRRNAQDWGHVVDPSVARSCAGLYRVGFCR